jgi:hypothetical protein
MPGGHQIAAEVLAGTDEVAQRFELGRGNHHRAQLPGGVQARELQRVARVGLDPIAGLARDRARRADHHLDPRRPRRPRQPEPRRPRLIDRPNLARQTRQPRHRRQRRTNDPLLTNHPRTQLNRRGGRLRSVYVKPDELDSLAHVDAPFPSMR